MQRSLKLVVLIFLISLVGCSVNMKKVLHDNFTDYTVGNSVPPLELPKGVELPTKDDYYYIPNVPSASHPAKVSLYPPGSRLQAKHQAHTSRVED